MALKGLQVYINSNTAGFDRGLKKVKSGLNGLQKESVKTNSGLSNLANGFKSTLKAGLALAGITAGLKALSDSVKEFVGLESSVNRVNDLFGESSKYISYFAQNTGKAFGMAESSAYQYAAVYGNLFKNITSSAQENSKVTISMLKASAVVASKTGRTMEDVMERIRSGLLGNTEAIEDLGINVNVAMLEMTDAFKSIANGRSWEQLTFYEQQQIRTLAILEQAHKNYGDEVQKGSAYSLSSLSSAFKDLTAYAGQFVNAGLQPIIRGLTELVKGATTALKSLASLMGMKVGVTQTQDTKNIESQSKAQKDLTKEVKKTNKAKQSTLGIDELNILSKKGPAETEIASGKAPGTGVFAGIETPEFEMKEQDTSWIDGIRNKLSRLSNFIKTKFSPTISVWGKSFGKIKGPALAAFDNIKGSMSDLWNNTLAPFSGYIVSDWIPSIANGFSETFAPIFSDTMPVLLDEFSNDFDFACSNIDRITKDVYQPSMEFMKGVAVDVFKSIKNSWDEHGAGILEGFQKFKESVRKIWNNLYENVFKPIFKYIGDTTDWLWDKHLKPLWDNLTDFFGSTSEFILMLWDNFISPFVNYIIKTVGPKISFVVGIIGGVIGTLVGFISDVIGSILKRLSGLMDFLTGVFTGNWKKAWGGIKKIVQGTFDGIWAIIKGVINLIIDGLNLLWGGIYSLAKGVVDSIGKVAGAIGKIFGKNWSFSLPATVPKIPKLAQGAIVDSPTLAMIGEDGKEAVMPLENNTGWIDQLAAKLASYGGSSGGDIVLTLYNVFQDDELIGRIEKRISRGNRTGNFVVEV